jgi:hypothetical protein
MAYVLDNPESHIGKAYKNAKGNTECVEFIAQTLNTPLTSAWKEGKKVKGDTSIISGTAIATFKNGVYPQTGNSGKHAAIYLSQSATGIVVVDQWRSQGEVKKRTIKFKTDAQRQQANYTVSNDGEAFSVIETTATAAKE